MKAIVASKETCMKRTLITLAIAAAAVMAVAPVANANAWPIDRKEATSAAWLKASDWGDANEARYGSEFSEVTLTRKDCKRKSKKVFVCSGRVEFTRYDADFNELPPVVCRIKIRVKRVGTYDTRELVTRKRCR